jgi:hypothetical protein
MGGNMKLLWIAAMFLLPASLCAQNSKSGDLNAMITTLKSHTIKRVEVLRIPDNVSSIVAITQDALRKSPSYSITMNNGFEPALESLLTGIAAEKSDKTSDLRWGVLLFDASGREIGSFFVDHFGMTGYLDGKPVQFSDSMSKRMRKFIQELR